MYIIFIPAWHGPTLVFFGASLGFRFSWAEVALWFPQCFSSRQEELALDGHSDLQLIIGEVGMARQDPFFFFLWFPSNQLEKATLKKHRDLSQARRQTHTHLRMGPKVRWISAGTGCSQGALFPCGERAPRTWRWPSSPGSSSTPSTRLSECVIGSASRARATCCCPTKQSKRRTR